jgi:hypothetical protein
MHWSEEAELGNRVDGTGHFWDITPSLRHLINNLQDYDIRDRATGLLHSMMTRVGKI